MPTPLEKLTTDWQTHYSDMPLTDFVTKVHGKMYSDIPFSDFTDKLGLTVPNEAIKPEPSPMSPVEGASPWAVGEGPPPGEFARTAAPIVAGIGAGMIPGVGGLVAGPLAAAVTDIAVNPKDATTGDRETSFLTDLGVGLLPGAAKGAFNVAKKLIPAPLEAKLASVIRQGFEKGVRPSVVGKSNAPQIEKYYQKAQSAVESIIENKPALQFSDDMGGLIKGQLPRNLSQFSGAIDQTKRSLFKQYDSLVNASDDLGRTVDLNPIVNELKAFTSNKVNILSGGSGLSQAQDMSMKYAGQKLTLSEAQDLLANLNARTKAYMRNPTPDSVSGFAVDLVAANNLRGALDTAVEAHGYSGLKQKYGALREIEKEVSNRALVDARKNTVGLIDYTDIFTAAEAVKAVATMSAGTAGAAGAMKIMKEWYKHINNPNNVIKNMFSDAEKLIGRRKPTPSMLALPPGPRAMGSGVPDPSGISVDTGPVFNPVDESSVRGQMRGLLMPVDQYSGYKPISALPERTLTNPPIPMPGSRNILWQAYGQGGANPAYSITDDEFLKAVSKKIKSKKK